jgi:hypothetical protein
MERSSAVFPVHWYIRKIGIEPDAGSVNLDGTSDRHLSKTVGINRKIYWLDNN